MQDFLGNNLVAGDKVVYIYRSTYSSEFEIGVIIRITPKCCEVKDSNTEYKRMVKSKYVIKLNQGEIE